MATTDEVTVSMGEVVMVKPDIDGDPDDPNKTQVILQLQPITAGYVLEPNVIWWIRWFWLEHGLGVQLTSKI